MHEVLKRIGEIGIVPVIKITDISKAADLAKALCDGGLPCAEVTFRAAGAAQAIKSIVRSAPDMLVGAGTVLTCAQADEAIEAGARFIVSPGLNPKVVRHCIARGVPITPGCATPSDIEAALELGLEVVKFFPAESLGGLPMIKALSAPYGSLRFIPTGGINAANLNSYLSFNKILACGGSWMVSEALIADGKFAEITALARQAVSVMLGFELAHVGINGGSEQEAELISSAFCDLFGFEKKPGNSAIFAGALVEVMKSAGRGARGHIGFSTNSLPRAAAMLKGKGVEFLEDTMRYGEDGQLKFAYLKQEIGGFAVHLLQK